MKIYLAGGFYTDWQERVIKMAPRHNYFNPKDFWKENLKEKPESYVPRDIGQICHSDLMIAYGEPDNPGAGYIFEMGYAAGVGVPYVFINEQKVFPEKYMDMFIWAASAYYTTFDWEPDSEGTGFLCAGTLNEDAPLSFMEDLKTDGMESFV